MKNTRQAITPLLGSIAALLLASALPPSAQAGQNWDGNLGVGTNVWTNNLNWDGPDTLPSFAAPLNFTTAFKLANTNDNVAGTIMNGIGFDGGAGAFVLSGNLITLASGGVLNNSVNLQTSIWRSRFPGRIPLRPIPPTSRSPPSPRSSSAAMS